jgi:transcriptional regulator with PAS, ATPase and Fis domain
MSTRRHAPFLAVNVAGLSPGLIDAELFGNRAGVTDGRIVSRLPTACSA